MAKVWVKGFTKDDGTKVKGHYREVSSTKAKRGFEYSHSFKNVRGNEVTQYKIDGGGYARAEKYPDGYVVTNIIIDESNQRKGYASTLYRKLNEESVKKTGKTLQSIKPDKTGKIELSSDGQKLWKALQRKGLAKSVGKNRWRFVK